MARRGKSSSLIDEQENLCLEVRDLNYVQDNKPCKKNGVHKKQENLSREFCPPPK